jgi:hypothetical protein
MLGIRIQLAIGAAALLSACSVEPTPAPPQPSGQTPESAAAPGYPFVDIAAQSGLEFTHWNGMSGDLYFVEPVGSGGALIDFDGDGDLDILLLQGSGLSPAGEGSDDKVSPLFPMPSKPGARLYRNDLQLDDQGRPHPAFTDVTDESGLVALGYGMGVAAGDYDNDGRIDLYITNFGSNQLWRNLSKGQMHFVNVTDAAGVDDTRWSTSASFVDVDADGWLDLFVVNYVDFRLENHRACRSPGGRQDYCGPQAYEGEPDRLFRNRGDGTFADITGPTGLIDAASSGLGVVASDLDLDGRVDLYVANDGRRNFLWRNLSSRDELPRFENIGIESGSAVSMDGRSQASMGVVAGDIDNDGDDDLFMTHLSSDTNTLYLNDGNGFFDDRTAAMGVGAASLPYTGFGTALLDIDNDGWLDLVVANGEVRVIEAQLVQGDPYPLKQPNQLFRNRGDGSFSDITAQAGAEFVREEVSRGIAVGDVDNDGRSDILLTNNNGPARLLHNRSENGHWIGLRALDSHKRDALGAVITLSRVDGPTLRRRVASDGSYLTASDPRVLLGLGDNAQISEIRIAWPDGESETWPALVSNTYHTLVQGSGSKAAEARSPD